ncbi:MAG: tRNA (guanine-N(7)-)-methyltransferase [Simkaniaceae bacterium]|nr:tRNA (guanine-N(7)-)-methyltransferase [Simkaniaceae bacterium]
MKPSDLHYPSSWEQRSPHLGDQILFIPEFYSNHHLWEKRPFFDDENPIHVELCSGNGEWILDRAEENPDVNWIAVEMKFKRVRKIWSKMKNRGIKNLLVVCGKAEPFVKYYLKQAKQVFVNFPDPWPKRRHAKNRLFQGEFISDLATCVTDELTFVSDDSCYTQQVVREMLGSKRWHSLVKDPYVENLEEGYGGSYFQRLWKDLGRNISMLRFAPSKVVKLDLSLRSRLDFPEVQGDLWHLDLGLDRHLPRMLDTMIFQSYRLGIGHFLETYEVPKRIILYDGSLDFVEEMIRTDVDMLAFTDWLKDEFKSVDNLRVRTGIETEAFVDLERQEMIVHTMGRQLMRLYCVDVLSNYLHRLSALLPEESEVLVRFDYTGVESESMIEQLLSSDRFAHLKILGREIIPSNRAICLPSDEMMSEEIVKQLDEIFYVVRAPYKVIPEGTFNENWHEIDEVIVVSQALSNVGKRMLHGFCAAGGRVLTCGERVGVVEEETWKVSG